MNVVNLSIDELKPYKNNPRFNDQAVEAVANSIKEFGFKVPIVVDKNNVIVAGHTRYKASKRLGLKEVPCIIADDLTDEQIKAFRLADNKVSELAEWDTDLLNLELNDLKLDMEQFGFIPEIENPEDKKKQEKVYEKMELRAFEHHDYLVFVFDNQMDFMQMAQLFGIQKVDAGYTTRKLGIGRVIKGEKLVEVVGHQGSNLEQGKKQDN